ncbi:response regulator transcription factor [Nonomuraea soli]|uniref:Two-component system response regulator DesR n=1 Tax=Nonomuraea soli TaxID=1032476 RepID=A0A7W0CJH2_9ACTN|nr:response regulator transcription factor [Nonomuraea soli]MBA2892263.1 two-component system response regulator DesR [Nonomuraea soli]
MTRILLAEDLHLIRGALKALIDAEPDMEVVHDVDNGNDIVKAALHCRPDVALVDIALPGLDGLTAVAELRRELPSCRAVILTGLATPTALRRALAADVQGFIVKDARPGDLTACIRRVMKGERVIDPELAVAALKAPENPLTARELDVLGVVAEGATIEDAAVRLCLSDGTVRNYMSRILMKVGARTRVEAVEIAREAGWLWPASLGRFGLIRWRQRR